MSYQHLEKCTGIIGRIFGHDFPKTSNPEDVIYCRRCGWVIHKPADNLVSQEARVGKLLKRERPDYYDMLKKERYNPN